jgi:hypothetical protein
LLSSISPILFRLSLAVVAVMVIAAELYTCRRALHVRKDAGR